LFLPESTRSGASQSEACWEKSFVSNKYGRYMINDIVDDDDDELN
jgi:hypothetical protein